jgi:NADH-quinone oxidoreductase subunit H
MSFNQLYIFVGDLLPFLPDQIVFIFSGLSMAITICTFILGIGAIYTWFERRVLAKFQSRVGPNRWGPFGLLQPIADAIKLILKEDIIPRAADKSVFIVAPIIFLATTLLVYSFIPIGDDSQLGGLNVALLFVLGITSINALTVFMAGWASKNKYAILGSIRAVAMLISYEVPMAVSLMGVVMLSESLSLVDIVNSQSSMPFILIQPLGALTFLIAAIAEMSRAPFDMVEAESELIGGYQTEYAGMKFAVFQLSEFLTPIFTAAFFTVLFLGGDSGFSFIPGIIWFASKTFLVTSILLWFRATWPRLRIDQIMGFAWKVLMPAAILNTLLVGLEIVFLNENYLFQILINSIVVCIFIYLIANILGQKKLILRNPVPSELANMDAN